MEQGFVYGKLRPEEIQRNPKEVAARLKTEQGYTNPLIARCEESLMKALDCRYSGVKVTVSFPEKDVVDLGGFRTKSHSLCQNLKGCREAFLFAVTLGMGVERMLNRLSLLSGSEFFVADALASAMAEAACDAAEKRICGEISFRPRFSPGYGDLSLEVQPFLLSRVQAQKLLGITLGASLLMSPMKSITAIMGVYHEDTRSNTEKTPLL